MRLSSALRAFLLVVVAIFPCPSEISAQSSQSATPVSVPHLIKINGVFHPADGQPAGRVESVTLSIYAEAEGGVPLWQEMQTIVLDEQGRYTVLLGATQEGGIPAAVFGSGDAQWLGTVFERPGELEGPRVRLASVPYAFKAQDAETLGGRPASDFVLTPAAGDHARRTASAAKADTSSLATPNVVLPGTTNFLAKYVNSADLGSSAVYATGAGAVGIGTTNPGDWLHVRFTNTGGTATGLAVQNLGNTASSYSGMLFYDQLGQLAQFQGFNNVSHEYRINNIATNASINFMTGSMSRFYVRNNGNIGIGTTLPSALLEVSNAVPGGPANMWMTSYTNFVGPYYLARRSRGTFAAPTAVQNGDMLAGFFGQGHGATGFGSTSNGSLQVLAAQNWTDTAQGTELAFTTTALNSTSPVTWMTLDPSGNLGIGTKFPNGGLEVSRAGDDAVLTATTYKDGINDTTPVFLGRSARGTQDTPTFTFHGDLLSALGGQGYGATGFGDVAGAMGVLAEENFTDTAHGSALLFVVTPVGTTDLSFAMGLQPSGFLGIGTPLDGNGVPTATDRLQVFGDARVGNAGTNGCLKRFDGTGLVGSCSSDRRLKRDITPFGPMLDKVAALQPVHYFWRASEFPDRHFGSSRSYGLIAQDVEQVLPELVATDREGYKTVDYSKLPLLTIQAVKDLKSENDALKQRVSELERLMNELLNRDTSPMTRR